MASEQNDLPEVNIYIGEPIDGKGSDKKFEINESKPGQKYYFKNKKFNLYQKIYINNFFDIIIDCKNIENLNLLNYRYFLIKEKEENSFGDKVNIFFLLI